MITFLISMLTNMYLVITGKNEEYWNKISPVIKLVFSNFLKKPNSEEEEEKFIVLGYETSLKEMYWLFYMLVQASLLAFAQFWDDFLLEVSGSCSTDFNLHCYYTTDSLLPYQELNCLNTSQVEEATSIICYKYVFNTGQAAASAIGIISATGLIIYITCIVFLKMLNGARLPICCITIVKIVAACGVTLFCVVLGTLKANNISGATDIFETINSFQKTLGMGIMITTSIFCFPVDKFRKSENRDGYEPLKFRKSENRDGYEPLINEPQRKTV